MNVFSIFLLAVKNIIKHRKHYFQLFMGIFLSIFFVMTAVIFSVFINSHIRDEFPDNSLCYLKYYDEDNRKKIKGVCKEAFDMDDVGFAMRIVDGIPANLLENRKFPLDIVFENTVVEIDGHDYYFIEIENNNLSYGGVFISQIDNTISDFSDFLYRYYEEPFICGSDCQTKNDILIPEQYLKALGIMPEQYNGLIGKKLIVKLIVPKNYNVTSEYTICGIVKEECYSDIPVTMMTQFNNSLITQSDIAYVFFDSYDDKSFDKTKKELDSIFGIKGSTCLAFDNIVFLNRQANFTKRVLMIILVMLTVAVIIHLSVYMFFYIDQNKMYYSLLYSLGMNQKRIAFLSFTEIALNTIISSFLGVILSYVVSFFVDRLINTYIALVMWRWDLLIVLIVTVVPLITFLLSSVMYAYTYRNVSAIPGIK